MTTYAVDVEASTHPSVTLYFDHKPTDDDIREELDIMAEQMDYEGYVAEFIVSEGGQWKTTITEYDKP